MNRRTPRAAKPALTPYDVNRSILFPFHSGPQSKGFVFKSAALYGFITTLLLFVFGKWIFGPFIEFFNYFGTLEAEAAEPTASEFLQMFAIMGKIMLPLMLLSIVSWIIMAIIQAAFYRRVFRGENETYPWRFGRDEVTVMLSQLVLGGIFLALMSVVYIVVIGLFLALGLGAQDGDVNGGLAALFGILMFVGFIAFFVLLVYLAIRLSPMAPLSVLRNKLSIKETWQVTQGRFWPVLLSFVIVIVLASIINYIVQIIMMIGIFGSAGSIIGELEGMENEDSEAVMDVIMAAITQPSFLIVLAVVVFLYTTVQAGVRLLYSGVVANAVDLYRQDLGETDLEVFD